MRTVVPRGPLGPAPMEGRGQRLLEDGTARRGLHMPSSPAAMTAQRVGEILPSSHPSVPATA